MNPTTSPSNREAAHLLDTVRELMKHRKLKYRDISKALSVSLPTVKRIFSGGDISISRLAQISEWLGLSLFELVEQSKRKRPEQFQFTDKQEEFFARHPQYLAYLFAIYQGELTPEEIEKRNSISKRSTQRYLKKLEQLGLLERLPGGKVRALMSGSVYWDDHGVLGQTFSRRMIEALSARALSKLGDPGDLHLALTGWRLTQKDYDGLKQDWDELSIKYRQISNLNTKTLPKSQLKHLSTMFIADFWDAKVFSTVMELRED
jgi:transcriptional regulator with XRE-family HTH domain